jgi:hypothetical protein
MVITVAKNLHKGASETVHTVAFTPTPRLIQLELAPAGEHKVLIGELAKTATHYVVAAPARSLAQGVCHAARTRAAGLPGMDRH